MLQPMNTAVQLALTAAWVNRGIKPTAVLGRCGGEFAAVHAGGGLSFEDALDLACRVGSLVRDGRGRGKMLHVRLSESETKDLCDACTARFAVISDAPNNSTIIACDASDAKIVTDFLSKHQVQHFLYHSGFAPHCWIAESWKEEMLRPLQQNSTACSIPIYSATSQGRLASGVDWTLHFWRVVREPLSIRAAVRSALDDGFRCFLEVGGHPILRNFILNEARAGNLNVNLFATMEWRRPLHEVMNATQAALTAAAPRQLESLHSPWPRSASSEAAVTSIQIDKADPYPVYARLRRVGPVFRANWLGSACWVVPRYRDALTVFKDLRFVRNPVNCGRPARHSPIRGFGRDLLELDPPDHTRLRKLVSKAFTPQMVQRFDRRVTQLAGQILDHAKPRGEIELISEYASVIPITVISELLGVPINDIGKFRNFMYALTISQMVGRKDSLLIAAKSRFTNYLHAIFAARRAAPQDDLVSSLVTLEHDDCDRLSPDELIGMVYLLLVAGFLTTVNLIGNGMLALLRHPEQLKMLRQNPALAETAIEELLRFDSPVPSSSCFTSTELDLSGVQIPRGALVRVLIASANRDEEQFPTPDTLDIARRPCPHLSFGQGSHYCLGASLARLEGRIAVNTLIERAPNLRLPDPSYIKWAPNPMLRGLQQLPLRF